MLSKVLISGNISCCGELKNGYIVTDGDKGIIEYIGFEEKIKDEFKQINNKFEYSDDFIIFPGDFNAHSHPEQSFYTDMVDKSWDLSTWCRNTIYKYTPYLTPECIYYACCRAFSRMLLLGVTSVMVSFYCHNNRENDFDRQVIKAALDTGIRLYFGRMNYDIINSEAYREKYNSQKCYYESIEEWNKNLIHLMNEYCSNERIVIAPAVHSIHASSKDAIINAINAGNKYGRYVQFHLSEDRGDVELSQKLYGMRPVEFLDDIVNKGKVQGLQNLILSDCIWIDDHERELILKHNMRVVLNPRMNNRIKAGESDIKKFIEAGVIPYLGTDGEASNDDLSITGEKGFLKDKNLDADIIEKINTGCVKFNHAYIGGINLGNYCDLKVIKNGYVQDVYVGGKKVVENSNLLNINIEKDVESPLKNCINLIKSCEN